MASCWVVEGRAQEEPSLAAVRNPDFSDYKYSLLLIIGQIKHANQTEHITREIERGIRSWDVDLTSCNLNLHLKDFLSNHTLQILKGTGQRCLRYSSGVLDTQVLISPSQEIIYSEVCGLLKSLSGHKLLILAGQSWEDTGDLLIDSGLFSPHHLSHILTEQFTDTASSTLSLPTSEAVLTLSCPNIGQWKKALLESQTFQGRISLRINPPVGLPTMEALGEFTSLLTGTLTLSSPFDCLQPPSTVGFLKLSRPCCYVFPAGRGDCAFFAVNGFTILVDGGSDPQACFWKLVRHLDRVDAVLLTHIGTENLPGVNALLERKLAELEMGSDVKGDLAKRLISPEIGVVFFNAPSSLPTELHPGVDGVLRSKDQAALTLRLLEKLNITPQPLFRQRAATIEPLTLFQKMGVGRLELYVLNPAKQSPEYQTLLQNWPDVPTSTTSSSAHTPTQTHPVTTLASVCALLVWHPSCPQEKVVRVLFPGITPQGKVLDGLEKLRGLAFFQKPTITTGELEGWGELETREARQAESQDSGRSVEKEVPVRPVSGTGKDRGNREEGKKDGTTKEKNKVTNGNGGKEEFKKEVDKVRGREGSAKQKVSMSEKTIKKVGVRDVKKEEKVVKKEESGPKKKEPLKKEVVFSKPKNEVKSKPKKEITKNDPKMGKITIKPLKEIKTDSNVDTKKSQGASLKQTKANMSNTISKIESPQPWKCLKVDQNLEIEGDSISNMSTPEDIAADFIRIRKEADEEEVEKKKGFDNGEKKSRDFPKQRTNESLGTAAENSVTKEVVSTVGGQMNEDHPMEGEDAGDSVENHDQPEKPPVKVVGFPSPLTKLPKHDCSKFQDLTPTEYTLLEGGLQESPPPRLTPENKCPSGPDPDEETVELASADSRPNSAGHTPYCLSPDDVWGCKDNESSSRVEKYSSPESLRHDEGQPASDSKTTANSREKRLSFLSLGSLKEGLTDVSPSVTATTTTTHSLPAEVSSPQSTEVDESLSMSFEQGPTNVIHREGEDSNSQIHSNGSHFVEADFRVGMSLPLKKSHRPMGPGPNTLHFDSTAHDVDLCLVSPCEFKHFKTLDSSQQPQPSDAGNHSQEISVSRSHSNNNRDKSASESNAPLGTEDCPSTTADGVLDSDDESCSDPSNSFHDPPTHHPLSPDPSPVPLKDIPPLPPQPGLCMPVPLPDTVVHGKGVKSGAVRGKKLSIVSEAAQRPAVGGGLTHTSKTRTGVQAGAIKGVKSLKMAPTKPGSKAGSDGVVNIYVDLAYLPSGPASSTVDVAFFKRVRSSCYIISGDNPEGEGLMRPTLDALLDAKASWPESLEVTLIPTFESGTMQEWYQQTLHRQRELSVSVLGSNSTVAMQDETFPACKIEF